MSDKSPIEWTDATWNPVTGCTKISTGCKNCYAERLAHRLQLMGAKNYERGFDVTLHPQMLDRPLSWKKPRRIFVNSMSDLFHLEIPDLYIDWVFDTMRRSPHHTFQVLTKRASRLLSYRPPMNDWPENVWMGVSIENREVVSRVADLRACGARVKFLSIEPLLGHVADALDLDGISWVIAGGESGPGARPLDPAWIRDVRDVCIRRSVPFFFKQWGGRRKSEHGRILDGRTWDEMPSP